MKLNRVVVTGYGVTSPIGNTPEEFWNSLTTGKIGIGPITKFDHSDFDVHNAAEIQDFPFKSGRPSGLRKTKPISNSLAHRTTWLRSDFMPIWM